jgi:hypothetical protein
MSVLPLALLITVRLYDASGLPAADLRSAILTAETALRSASVRAAWVVCPTPASAPADNSSGCTGLPRPSDLLVRIVKAPAMAASHDTLGFATLDTTAGRGTLATVFADRIATLAERADMDRGALVGYAIAHELGHLLLGTAAHARGGLMRAVWTVPEMRRRLSVEWRFSAKEAQLLSDGGRSAATAREAQPAVRADRSASRDMSGSLIEAPGSDPPSARTPAPPAPAPPTPTAIALRAR